MSGNVQIILFFLGVLFLFIGQGLVLTEIFSAKFSPRPGVGAGLPEILAAIDKILARVLPGRPTTRGVF